MASTKAYLDYVLEQLSGLEEISYRAMMGEYILYYRGKVFGGIYDDRLLIKPVPAAVRKLPDAPMELDCCARWSKVCGKSFRSRNGRKRPRQENNHNTGSGARC